MQDLTPVFWVLRNSQPMFVSNVDDLPVPHNNARCIRRNGKLQRPHAGLYLPATQTLTNGRSMHSRLPSRALLPLAVLAAVPLDAWAGPRTTWPSTIALVVLFAVLLGVRMYWRRFTGQEDEVREPPSKPSLGGALILIAVGAGGTVVAFLAYVIGPAGGMLALLGNALPYAIGVFCFGIYLAFRAR